MQAAADELNEEAGLQAARLIPLTISGIPADKYSANRLYCFIALDCTILQDKRPLDDTEDIGETPLVTSRPFCSPLLSQP